MANVTNVAKHVVRLLWVTNTGLTESIAAIRFREWCCDATMMQQNDWYTFGPGYR